jgi:hypothetical protein
MPFAIDLVSAGKRGFFWPFIRYTKVRQLFLGDLGNPVQNVPLKAIVCYYILFLSILTEYNLFL